MLSFDKIKKELNEVYPYATISESLGAYDEHPHISLRAENFMFDVFGMFAEIYSYTVGDDEHERNYGFPVLYIKGERIPQYPDNIVEVIKGLIDKHFPVDKNGQKIGRGGFYIKLDEKSGYY